VPAEASAYSRLAPLRQSLFRELERIRRMIEEFESIEAIDDEMRDLVEKHWPWLVEKLPPRTVQ
jgi:hypothetical protein